MIDREKVIKGLEVCTVNGTSCNGCPYYGLVETIGCVNSIMEDALALLREQETTFILEPDRYQHYHCEKCGYVTGIIARRHKFCPSCGRKVGGE